MIAWKRKKESERTMMAKNQHEYYMTLALEEAEKAKQRDEVPVGAVVVWQNTVIAKGHNLRETNQSPLAHAEILVIQEAAAYLKTRRLKECTLYVTLEPCPMCAGALVMANMGTCVFGAYDKRQGCCGSIYSLPEDPAFYHHTHIIGGVMKEEAERMLGNFFMARR